MEQGLKDILNKAKELSEKEELTPYPISCMTLIDILERLAEAERLLENIKGTLVGRGFSDPLVQEIQAYFLAAKP
jgi:hypothetical protein